MSRPESEVLSNNFPINEGIIKKGGLNSPPSNVRPAPPSGQGGSSASSQGNGGASSQENSG